MKLCLLCNVVINNNSKQYRNKKYCTDKCRTTAHDKKKSQITRTERKRANLRQNDEVLYLVRQCKRAKTVQILNGHNFDSFEETMELVRNRPKGDVKLCHIAPVKGKKSTGLLHCQNLFYGGSHQNRKFGKSYISGGLSIRNKKLKKKWSVTEDLSINDILIMIEKYLVDIIPEYIKTCPVRKSKKVQVVSKIIGLDESKNFDELMLCSYTSLVEEWAKTSKTKQPVISYAKESKYIAYMDSLTRFIRYGGDNVSTLRKLRKIMVIAYMALERVQRSETYNKLFYVKYEPLINHKYGQAMLKNPDDWSVFKDLIYRTAFKVLQGDHLDTKKFRKEIMSYLTFPEKAWLNKDIPYEISCSYPL